MWLLVPTVQAIAVGPLLAPTMDPTTAPLLQLLPADALSDIISRLALPNDAFTLMCTSRFFAASGDGLRPPPWGGGVSHMSLYFDLLDGIAAGVGRWHQGIKLPTRAHPHRQQN